MLDIAQQSPYRELAHLMSEYRQRLREGQVVDSQSYDELRAKLDSIKTGAGDESWSVVWDMVDHYLDDSVKTAHPLYFNQLWAGQSEPALIGGVIELMANTSMYTFEVAPMATVVENEMRAVFARQLGMSDWESQVTSGGSNSNFLALLLALHKRFPNFKQTGLQQGEQPRVYVSEDAHYSSDKAVMMAGLGLNSLVKVPVDQRGAMDVKALKELIHADQQSGFTPCLIVATAGTTVKGAFDPYNELADVAEQQACWLHIDGAWGGAITYASDASQYLDGSTRADSFSWDAHKMLGVPLMCSLIFVRQPGAMNQAFNLGDTSYIFHDDNLSHDLGPSSLQCGRRVDMLKMWLEYLFYGNEGFRNRIDHFLKLSEWAEQRVEKESDLELQSERWINNICFRSKPAGLHDEEQLNTFNKTVRDRLKAAGSTFVNQAYLGDALTIRLVIANKDVTAADITRFFDLWVTEAQKLEKEWNACKH